MSNEATPTRIGKYRIDRVLGTGAMGVVYLAFDPHLERPVALKTVRRELLAGEDTSGDMLLRFRNEARAAGRLAHPNIVTVHDFGEDGDTAYIVMEYVAGHGLDTLLVPGHALPLSDAFHWLAQLLAALAYAHEAGVVHRDIKPANLLVTAAGLLKVADFGVARIGSSATSSGWMIGTPSYMSPEQFEGESVDARADLFSAGVVLYRMLTGRQPFVGSPATIRQKIIKDAPARPSEIVSALPPALDAMVAKALARRPDDRFGSAAQWLASLRSLAVSLAAADDDRTIVTPSAYWSASASLPAHATGVGPAPMPVPSAPPSWPPAPSWPPEMLARIERQLATQMGPLASLLVRRAATQANDLPTLGAQLAAALPDTARLEFEQAFARLTAGLPDMSMVTSSSPGSRVATSAAKVSAVSPASAAGTSADSAIDQASIDAVAVKLAVYLGPIAKMIASREARHAANFDEFVQRVEDCITDPAQRGRFRRDVESSS
ncbi:MULTISPECIES: serine/threonine-protein kinase [unclassified Paraburkholderia]|uniref:serine/threonine-protein kinase n=1 Tax=unclassified Paraburkholderia TaxID=2615204 RepID=UPI00161277FF|nr:MULTISPECIES: serine/threonine-protein kinase [unclassified Paraburkholderia]MBB5447195.1 serine/threonine-protein kinase [Paraburkholderia sp. WSM4177]MBB5487700.1 serine/threonine-protein kinase [Paraburkholderia sp. WSM4180]